jgi:hypothetical protein
VLWTNPGSQGWRPVGGLVLHGALKRSAPPIALSTVPYQEADTINRILACRASHEKPA